MRNTRILRRVASGGAVIHGPLSLRLLILVGGLLVVVVAATAGLIVAGLVVDKDINSLTAFGAADVIGVVNGAVVVKWWGRVLRNDVPGV